MALIVIPARYDSTRFPGKPLTLIEGLPMVVKVYNQAIRCKLADNVVIATDDERIFNSAQKFNCNVTMTSSLHKSGTDRVAEAASKFDSQIIVNLQGDEPFISPELIDQGIKILQDDISADISTPVKLISNQDEIENRNVVKVVFGKSNYALYFSRSAIPYFRETNIEKLFYKHIGLYIFRKESLNKFIKFEESYLEKVEKLEQLRALENHLKIKIYKTDYESIAIDTPDDLKRLKISQ